MSIIIKKLDNGVILSINKHSNSTGSVFDDNYTYTISASLHNEKTNMKVDTVLYTITESPKAFCDKALREWLDKLEQNDTITYAVVKVKSQGRIITELYKYHSRTTADTFGKNLIAWFNATGGNRDGSLREFVEAPFEMVCYQAIDYYLEPYVNDKNEIVLETDFALTDAARYILDKDE